MANAQAWGSEQFPLVLEPVGLGVSGREEGKESRNKGLDLSHMKTFVGHCRKFGLNVKVGRESGARIS